MNDLNESGEDESSDGFEDTHIVVKFEQDMFLFFVQGSTMELRFV